MRSIRVRLTLAFAVVALITAAAALNLALVYFERRLAGLPPDVASQVDRRLSLAGGDFDGFRELSAVVAVSLACGLVAAVLLARRLSRPLRALSGAARRVAGGDLAARADVRSGRDELGALVTDFNAMAATLEAWEHERRVTSAAIAHELRTPLAALTARLQALHDGVLRWDEQEPARLLRHTDVLARLVEDLRTLSLADAGRLRLRRRRTDLRATVAEAVTGHGALAAARGVALTLTGLPDGPALTDVDVDRIGQVLANVLANAIRHTPPGGGVTVAVGAGPGRVAVTVDDSGPGVPADQRERVFDRFARLGSPEPGDGGSGLGLAVAQALVRGHGGSITMDAAPAGGARVEILLPTAPA
ncbi:ATP-binding protein [Micromonospora mangrovi]|uniref:histidine kinase n=2 Tax=Micromonospora TaxID=1873 RepID=A0AAU7MDQ8_9ACTN